MSEPVSEETIKECRSRGWAVQIPTSYYNQHSNAFEKVLFNFEAQSGIVFSRDGYDPNDMFVYGLFYFTTQIRKVSICKAVPEVNGVMWAVMKKAQLYQSWINEKNKMQSLKTWGPLWTEDTDHILTTPSCKKQKVEDYPTTIQEFKELPPMDTSNDDLMNEVMERMANDTTVMPPNMTQQSYNEDINALHTKLTNAHIEYASQTTLIQTEQSKNVQLSNEVSHLMAQLTVYSERHDLQILQLERFATILKDIKNNYNVIPKV